MSSWGSRVCAACRFDLSEDCLSRRQWGLGIGASRCAECVGAGVGTGGDPTLRRTNALKADGFDFTHPDAEGSFRNVFFGRFTSGGRAGQRAVAKVFKAGHALAQDSFFAREADVVEKAGHILTQWNGANISDVPFRLNVPEVWTATDGMKFLCEPFIEDYQKFNSNSGWTQGGAAGSWSDLMQALSHYSYQISGGQFLLCDLQGSRRGGNVILTDPVIQSRSRLRFGPTDLGPEGIASFFAHHVCGSFCRGDWTMPRRTARAPYAPSARTSMAPPAPADVGAHSYDSYDCQWSDPMAAAYAAGYGSD